MYWCCLCILSLWEGALVRGASVRIPKNLLPGSPPSPDPSSPSRGSASACDAGRKCIYSEVTTTPNETRRGDDYYDDDDYTPPTRRHCRVESRRRCVRNWQLVGATVSTSLNKFAYTASRVASCRLCERTRRQSS